MGVKGSRNPYRKKINVLVDLWTKIIEYYAEGGASRKEIEELLRKYYEEKRVVPFKGKATPEDLYDKELTSLYVVGKYGLGLDKEYREIFDEVFYHEKTYERIIELLLREEHGARELILNLLGGSLEPNTLARILRVMFTMVVLGFRKEEEFYKLLRVFANYFPEHKDTLRKYTRFYIAFRVAEAIAKGEVKNKVSKEALKQSLALRIGFERSIPDDKYIYTIAREVFKVPQKILKNTLNIEEAE